MIGFAEMAEALEDASDGAHFRATEHLTRIGIDPVAAAKLAVGTAEASRFGFPGAELAPMSMAEMVRYGHGFMIGLAVGFLLDKPDVPNVAMRDLRASAPAEFDQAQAGALNAVRQADAFFVATLTGDDATLGVGTAPRRTPQELLALLGVAANQARALQAEIRGGGLTP